MDGCDKLLGYIALVPTHVSLCRTHLQLIGVLALRERRPSSLSPTLPGQQGPQSRDLRSQAVIQLLGRGGESLWEGGARPWLSTEPTVTRAGTLTWLWALSSWFSRWHWRRACLSASSACARWAFSKHFWEYCSESTSSSRCTDCSSSLRNTHGGSALFTHTHPHAHSSFSIPRQPSRELSTEDEDCVFPLRKKCKLRASQLFPFLAEPCLDTKGDRKLFSQRLSGTTFSGS